MNVKIRIAGTANHFLIAQITLTAFLFMPSLLTAAYGSSELVKDDLAFLAEEGQVVQSAAKYPQLIKDTPALVTVITRDEMRLYGWRTLADLFKSVRGFYVTDDKDYNYLGVDGFLRPGDYNSRILAMINGHTINDDVYQQFMLGRDSGIDLDIVDRVEIVRGPASSLYGTDAVFAVVNIITKDGKDIDGLRTSLEAGTFNSDKAVLSYGKAFSSGLDVLLDASYYGSSGQTLYFSEFDNGNPANHAGITNNDGEHAYNLFGRARFQDFTLQIGGNDRLKRLPTAAYGAIFNNGSEKTYDGHYLADLKYDHTFQESYGLMIRLYDDWYRYRGYYPVDYPPPTINKDLSVGQYYGEEIQFRWDFQQWNKLIFGSEYQRHRVLLKNYDMDPYFSYLDVTKHFSLLSFYVEDDIKPFPNLSLSLGARRDQYFSYDPSFSEKITPRLGLVYTPIPGTALKFLYGQAFRAPNSFELFYCGTNIACGAQPKPETMTMYQAAWEQSIGAHLSSSLSGFTYVYKDLIDPVLIPGTGKTIFENLSHVRGKGVEAEFKGQWPGGWEGYANGTYQSTWNDVTQSPLSNSPHVLAKAGGIVPIEQDEAFFSFEEQYVGKRDEVVPPGTTAEYYVTNLTFTFLNLVNRLEIQASVLNLFNEKYYDPSSFDQYPPILQIPQPGRNFYLKASYRF